MTAGGRTEKQDGLTIVGWACAIVIPLAGLLIGILVLSRGRTATGLGMIALAAVASVFWYMVLWG